MATEGRIPVYLPNRVEIGQATITQQENGEKLVEVRFLDGGVMEELIGENLIGLSVMYMGASAQEAVVIQQEESEKEN